MTMNNPVSDLIALAERLSSLLAQETELLAAARTTEIGALQGEKAKLARAFETQVAKLGRGSGALTQLEPSLKAALRRVMAKARDAIAENARRLRAARDANQKLINAIVKAVTDHNRKLDVYTASGSLSASVYGGRPVRKAVSLSINQQL